MGRFDIRTRSGLLSTIVQGQTASPSDGDAQAFIYRVESAGGTLTTTEKDSVNTLVIRLKAANIWTKMKALYPMVGASAAACAQNLKSDSFTGAFSSGWTFASAGATPNGSSAFMNTGLNTSTNLVKNSAHLSLYSITNTAIGGYDIANSSGGGGSTNPTYLVLRYNTNLIYFGIADQSYATNISTTDSRGFTLGTTNPDNTQKVYKNGALILTGTPGAGSLANVNLYLGANNDNGTAGLFSNKQYAFASIGTGLSSTEASDFYNIVQEFQTLLGRQIGAPAVSDADASAFIQRVYTAGGTLTTAEQNAVNQLTIDLKAASIWTGMKAVYPMVGASAAACAQNLRTGSFTGTFNGTITYATTGITGNAVNGYMNTGLNASTVLTPANNHISFYSRNNPTPSTVMEIGANTDQNGYNGPYLRVRLTGFGSTDQLYYASGDNISSPFAATSSNLDSRGYFIGNILSTTNRKVYKNGSLGGTNTTSGANSLSNANIYVLANGGAGGTPSFYSNKECAFASIGDGLTDTQAVYFNNAVETFQTSLSRNVGATIPTVSDADATDFIARVYGAGGTLSALEQNAVNQLVISMKAVGVWTAMKAVYPMVGASAAACAQNLKSNLYTGTFNGSWAYSSNGITGNGTNTYMNTTLVPSTDLSQNSAHLAGYLKTTNSSNHMLIGAVNIYVANYGYAAVHNADVAAVNVAGQIGFFLNSRLMSTQYKQYKNNAILGTYTTTSTTPTAKPISVGAWNDNLGYTNYVNGQIAFASIGDGLTDTQESDYYSAVQAFQTTLSRNV